MNILELRQKYICFESFSMSIAELSSIYFIGGLIAPLSLSTGFKLDLKKKSKLMESILIGEPLKYFVMIQDYDTSWQVIKGGKRLSAILSFMGVDRDFEPYPLADLKYCTELSGAVWDEAASLKNNSAPYLSNRLKRGFLETRVDIKVIHKEKLGFLGMRNLGDFIKSEEQEGKKHGKL